MSSEISSIQSHIKVITIQNKELTNELDRMVKANEEMRE